MPSTAASMSASSKTMTGALPPSSRWTRLTSWDALSATCMPARTEPVMATRAGVLCSTSARPVSRSPVTTLKVPGGRNSAASSASSSVVSGVVSRRLEDDGVAGGERRGDLPDRHHHRVVPRRDLADDPDRLAADPRGVARHVLPRRLALEHARRAGEEPQLVDHRRDLLARRSARAACRCSRPRGGRTRRRAPRWRRRTSAAPAGARSACVSPHSSKAAAAAA